MNELKTAFHQKIEINRSVIVFGYNRKRIPDCRICRETETAQHICAIAKPLLEGDRLYQGSPSLNLIATAHFCRDLLSFVRQVDKKGWLAQR